jgi:hypothetical protein
MEAMTNPLRGRLGAGIRWAAAVAAIVAGPAWANVVLNPGAVTGKIGITGVTFDRGGYAQIAGNSSGYGASASFTGNAFSLTVEGNQTYSYLSVSANASMPASQLTITSQVPRSVPAGATTQISLERPGGTITTKIIVTGGRATAVNLYADSSDSTAKESYSAYGYGATSATVVMVENPNVRVYGNVTIEIPDASGVALCSVRRPITARYVPLSDTGAITIAEEVSVSAASCDASIAGDVQLQGISSGAVPTWGQAYLSGPAYRDKWAQNTSKFSYLFDRLSAGRWFPRARFNIDQPHYGRIDLPYGLSDHVDLADGDAIRNDFVFDAVEAQATLNMTGRYAGKAGSQTIVLLGAGPSTAGGFASAEFRRSSTDPVSATARPLLTPGDWRPYVISLSFSDRSAGYEQYSSVSRYDYSQAIVTARPGSTLSLAASTIDTSDALVYFDVAEPPGSPVIGISQPSVSAYRSNGSESISLYSWSNAVNSPSPSVKLIGPPGTYNFSARAYIQGTFVQFANSTVELGQPVNTPVGTNVSIIPKDGAGADLPVTLDFQQITGGGDTTASITDIGPAAPTDFIVLSAFLGQGPNGQKAAMKYLDINTSANFTGKVLLALQYDPLMLGLSAQDEKRLTLQHYVCSSSSNCKWEVINETYSADPAAPTYFGRPQPVNGNPDLVNHVIYGVTSSFSVFALTLPKVIPVPPTDSCIGTTSEPAPLSTDANVCSVTVNNKNQKAGGCQGGGGGLASCTFNRVESLALSPGTHEVAIVGTANDGSFSSCSSWVRVNDRETPLVSCPSPTTIECTGEITNHALIASCSDNCERCTASCGTGGFTLGVNPAACSVTDASDNVSSCSTTVTVVDTTLWPPNHKLKPVEIHVTSSDACDPAPQVKCVATSNEADDGLGDGDTSEDIQWKGTELLLRSERSGTGTGRVYTVTCTATDASKNVRTASATVSVPLAY